MVSSNGKKKKMESSFSVSVGHIVWPLKGFPYIDDDVCYSCCCWADDERHHKHTRRGGKQQELFIHFAVCVFKTLRFSSFCQLSTLISCVRRGHTESRRHVVCRVLSTTTTILEHLSKSFSSSSFVFRFCLFLRKWPPKFSQSAEVGRDSLALFSPCCCRFSPISKDTLRSPEKEKKKETK